MELESLPPSEPRNPSIVTNHPSIVTNMSNPQDNYRFQSDGRQFGGLLMLLSFAALINSLSGIIAAYGPNGAVVDDANTTEWWILFSYFCQFIWATTGAFAGYMACVHDYSNKWLNIFLMFAIQLVWIGYITMMVEAGQGGKSDVLTNPFIPLVYQPTEADVRFVGAMGILGVITYGLGFAGSIAFMVWGLHAYTTGEPESHGGDYYKGRMFLYSSFLAFAGLIQFILGCAVRGRFGDSLFRAGPIICVFWVVTYPGIHIFIGIIQMFNGIWGVARAFNMCDFGMSHLFQWSLAFQWIMVLIFQDLVTFAYWGAFLSVFGPTLATFSLGLNLMPAYLDHKHHVLPESLPNDYYGTNPSLSGPDPEMISQHQEEKKEPAPEAPVEVKEGV